MQCGFGEPRDTVVVWIVGGRRVIICSDHRVGPAGLITCEVGTFGQVARHVLTLVGVRWTNDFRSW